MTDAPSTTWRALHIDDVARFPDTPTWLPLRRELGVTGFGINGYVGDEVGGELVEPHDETSAGSGRHEEVYLVLSGRATFTVDGEDVDAPAGTFVFVPPGVQRSATTREAPTTIVILGGRPGSALPVSPFEHWYLAEGPYLRGDYDEAYRVATPGLVDHPQHPHLNYQLACYSARGGHVDRALEHLRIAAADDRVRGWIADDEDFAALRDDPRFRQLVAD